MTKLIAAFFAGAVLAAAGTAGAEGSHHLAALLERVGLVEQQQEAQTDRLDALETRVRTAQQAAETAESTALWALENSWSEARQLRACGMKPTIRKQNVCFFRLF